MKISKVKISNFRSYSDEVTIDINDLTTFVGKNDVGKSTVLEALDIFFNEGKDVVKLDKDDVNKFCQKNDNIDIKISVIFDELRNNIIIDSTNETTLADEYLLNKESKLEIIKIYPNAGKEKVFIKAYHPTNPECKELLYKKQNELKKIIDDKSIQNADKNINASMRNAIWQYYSDNLQLDEVELDVTKEDTKNIWNQLKSYMPLYALFQSDRKNSDGDNEIQDPMKLAVQEIFKEQKILVTLNEIAEQVNSKLKDIAQATCEKLKEMNAEIAETLNPSIPASDTLKWSDVFKNLSIVGDEDIPINKRGSGVKRLVLLNFFRAEAERRKKDRDVPDVIYAIEEPETSQHPEHQKKLIDALIELSKTEHTQIILTTHSPALVKMLNFEHLRLIKSINKIKEISNVDANELPYPSLNEINHVVFSEATAEYHNELYGFIDIKNWLNDYKNGKEKVSYQDIRKPIGKLDSITLTEYIRHQIHHPENTLNTQYTLEQLQMSIQDMRNFIQNKKIGVNDNEYQSVA